MGTDDEGKVELTREHSLPCGCVQPAFLPHGAAVAYLHRHCKSSVWSLVLVLGLPYLSHCGFLEKALDTLCLSLCVYVSLRW